MKKILMIFLILSLLMAGIAVGGEIVGTRTNREAVPNKIEVPNKVTATDKAKVLDKGTIRDNAIVPNVIGLPLMQGVAVLKQNGLEWDESRHQTDGDSCKDNKGNIAFQKPDAGERVALHSSVILGWCN
jgi:hypothetical protein